MKLCSCPAGVCRIVEEGRCHRCGGSVLCPLCGSQLTAKDHQGLPGAQICPGKPVQAPLATPWNHSGKTK